MSSFREVHILPEAINGQPPFGTKTITNDLTIFNWTGTNITSMTPTRVDTATAGTPTGGVTFNATDTVAAANMQVAIRALGGIYADATVVAGVTADNMLITVFGGYDITWAQAGGVGTFTEAGAAGSDTAVVGGAKYATTLPIGKYAVAKKIVLKGFNDNSLDISIVDKDGKNVLVSTGIDTTTAGADVPYVQLLTADGIAGEDGAAAANVNGGLFRGPLAASVTLSAPTEAPLAGEDRKLAPRATLVVEGPGNNAKQIRKRSSGARTALSGTFNLGERIAKVRKIRLVASADTTVAPTLTDADGLVIYTKTSTNYTTAVLEQLSHAGIDQANNAVADLLDVVAKSPITISGTGLDSGTFTFDLFVEV